MSGSDSENSFFHRPIMPEEVIHFLNPLPGQVFIDGTLGGGGHARLILEKSSPNGFLVGIDRDPEALNRASGELSSFKSRTFFFHGNFSQMDQALAAAGFEGADGILLDVGVSSHQLNTEERGFSFSREAPLDMRMDRASGGMTAADAVNRLEQEELEKIFREYGEERWARRISRRIVRQRQEAPLSTTLELADLVRNVIPGGHKPSRIHPATRVFQALRIFVNDELEHLRKGLEKAIDFLKPDGRLVVLTFHSLEARIVKSVFQAEATGCICPPRLPVCVCGRQPRVKLLTRKGVKPGPEEIDQNPRARSAVLRAVRRL
ncbi:MAG: 16S rRNA (cytosine(1402)-N(4))-methyltransferase RsmH [Deltaproteobacteria bacterium]|nr:16S rRNA (cytosine(1402)-N(4))-methyltransferase RsmH [Deltaproteobacteria bacterium]